MAAPRLTDAATGWARNHSHGRPWPRGSTGLRPRGLGPSGGRGTKLRRGFLVPLLSACSRLSCPRLELPGSYCSVGRHEFVGKVATEFWTAQTVRRQGAEQRAQARGFVRASPSRMGFRNAQSGLGSDSNRRLSRLSPSTRNRVDSHLLGLSRERCDAGGAF